MSAVAWNRLKVSVVLACAGFVYFYRIDRASFSANEAYSILAATQNSLRAVVAASLAFDPGKPPLYQLLLHEYLRVFGVTEFSARSFSACLSLVTAALVYRMVATSVSERAGLLAATLWSFNPYAVMIAQWVRPYSLFALFIALSMLTLWRARRAATTRNLAALSASMAASLYAHMVGLLCLAAAALLVATDFQRKRDTSTRVAVSLLVSLLIFLPFLATEMHQAHSLLYGHWLDWAGARHEISGARILAALVAAAVALLIAFLPFSDHPGNAPALHYYLVWALIPASAIVAISLALRPLWAIRYFMPSLIASSAILAIGLNRVRPVLRGVLCGTLLVGFLLAVSIYEFGRREPWPLMNVAIHQADGEAQPVFFEKGSLVSISGPGVDGFPQGYFRVPFDFYYRGSGPRFAVDSSDPAAARTIIGTAAQQFGGAWLVSGKDARTARNELPEAGFVTTRLLSDRQATLYHVTPSGKSANVNE